MTQEEILHLIGAIRNSFANCEYETRNEDFLRKTAISDRSVKLADRFPNGVRKVQTMRGTVGLSLDYERKVKMECARQCIDGSAFIAQSMSGLEWLAGYEGLVAINKGGEYVLRFYLGGKPNPPKYYHGDVEIAWEDLADFHPAPRKPYVKVIGGANIEMPEVRALKFCKIIHLAAGGNKI